MASSDDAAVIVRLSLSASLNTPDSETWWVPLSLTMVASPMAEDTVGAWLGCWLSDSISFSAAVTSTHRVQPRSA